jgi:plastocyanin
MRNALALLVALSLLGCGGDSTEAPKPAAPAAEAPQAPVREPVVPTEAPAETEGTAPAEPAPPPGDESASAADAPEAKPKEPLKDGAHVSFSGSGGRAHWVGAIPAPKTLSVKDETAKDCHHDGPMDTSDPSLIVDAGAGVANVVIEVEPAGVATASAAEPFVMDQHGCRFAPHVLLVPEGATVQYGNSDPFTHNVNVVPRRNDAMNVMVDGGGQRSATYPDSDQIQVKCDIHPWMGAWVYVSDAPVHVLSAADGSFALPALPPGSHKVSCWHESLGKASGTLVVGADGSIAELDLAIGKKR